MADQTEKLKALALAATNDMARYLSPGTPGYLLRFSLKVTPVVVLELIADNNRLQADRLTFRIGYETASNRCCELEAEVERLRAELATRCRAEGGGTSDNLDRWTGHEIMNDPSLDCVEFVKLADVLGSAPAAGTDKDTAWTP